jgi:hypothetical protein
LLTDTAKTVVFIKSWQRAAKQKAATSFEVAAFFTTWWRIRDSRQMPDAPYPA